MSCDNTEETKIKFIEQGFPWEHCAISKIVAALVLLKLLT